MLAENAEDYIPKLAVLQNDMRNFKKQFEKELINPTGNVKVIPGAGPGLLAEDATRFEYESLRRNLHSTD